ncbi:MAG: 3-methyl-2-oxobutanoate hydroxymethyltransferase [Candidatus Kryptoniota bacterium]
MTESGKEKKIVTTRTIVEMKARGEKIAALTAYDAIIARLLDESGIDIILVGDSLSNVFQGNDTTIPVTMEEMIYHAKIVRKAVKRALVVVDMPFMSYQVNAEEAVRNAGRILKDTGASAVKIEGGEAVVDSVRKMTEVGIPVMGHLGLTPQSIHKFGGYKPRGEDRREARQIIRDAKLLQEAGAFSLVLEKIPSSLASKISNSLVIPTIGIGAGPNCDGQILVYADMLGLTRDFRPRFVRRYAEMANEISNAFSQYINDVKGGNFPSAKESY